MSHLRAPLLLLSLALCACTGLFHSSVPEVQLYVLQPPHVAAESAAGAAAADSAPLPTAPTLRLARPLPAADLNTDRIALTRPGNRLDYFAGGRWSAPLSDMVSDLELAALRTGSTWRAVADDRSSLNADYVLQTSIGRFTADYATQAAAPIIQVELHCLLIRRSDGVLIGSFAANERQQAPENRMGSVVATFSEVADRALLAVASQADALIRSAKPPAVP